jgi:hypothetical protein
MFTAREKQTHENVYIKKFSTRHKGERYMSQSEYYVAGKNVGGKPL